MIYDPIRQSLPDSTYPFSPPAFPQPNVSAMRYSATNSNRVSSSIPINFASGNRTGLTPEVGPRTPGSEYRLQVLSGFASGNHILPPLSTPFTPPSNYEPSVYHGASPTSSLADTTSSHQQQRTSQLNSSSATHSSAEMADGYAHDFAQNSLTSGSYSYLDPCGPITDAITVEEINIGSLGLPNDMMPPWDLFPGDFTGLFDTGHPR